MYYPESEIIAAKLGESESIRKEISGIDEVFL